jgi:hypothetical protein
MNRIVRKHYPVERLPEDLRPTHVAGRTVTITVQEDEQDQTKSNISEMLNQMKEARDRMPRATDDPVTRIRRLRDEWEN